MKIDFPVEAGSEWLRQCVGVDISKDKFTACICMYDLASDKRCVSQTVEFENCRRGFNQLVKWSRKEAYNGCRLSYLMEPTGVYYEPLAYHLHKISEVVYVVLPNKARDFCNYEGIKTKTDEIDARCLALMGCTNRRLSPWFPPKPIFRELRQMTRFNQDIQKVRSQVSNHLEALLHSESPEKTVVLYYERLLAQIDEQVKKNEQRMLEKVATDQELAAKVERLNTIKGIGRATIITLLAETDGFAMIRNRKQLASYAGLDVIAKQSGKEDPRHVISKKGNSRIRQALYMPAMVSIRFNAQQKALYMRICERNSNVKMKGIVATMRKMLLLVYTLWVSGETYDPTRALQPLEK